MLDSKQVHCATAPRPSYDGTVDGTLPEFPGEAVTPALDTLHRLLRDAGLDPGRVGSPDWNPFGDLVQPDTKVLVKPNWVRHVNGSGGGADCLITHGSVIEAIVKYLAHAGLPKVIVGDAPVQGCNFDRLLSIAGTDRLVHWEHPSCELEIEDLRRTVLAQSKLGAKASEGLRPVDDYVLFDLGADSALEAITDRETEFRVTMYDPDLLMRRHRPGVHQYLIARSVMDADLVINVPKLKTHKKAGVTGALKNLVGINGNKEFLPHHRKGGANSGGDCYPGRSPIKSTVESMLDATNRTQHPTGRRALALATRAVHVTGRLLGGDGDYEGSWHGNDTVWRMCLDLQRILHYGRVDGTIADTQQRRVLSITDAIIAGDGNGPLAPDPLPLGLMTYAWNPCAAEWAHALLMGFDPARIPLIRHSFDDDKYPLVSFTPKEVATFVDGDPIAQELLFDRVGQAFNPPAGWRGHCERADTVDAAG